MAKKAKADSAASKRMMIEVPDSVASEIKAISKETGINQVILKKAVGRILFSTPIDRTAIVQEIFGIKNQIVNEVVDELTKRPKDPSVIKPPTMSLAKELGQ